MDEKAKQIVKDSALVLADQIASNIGLNVAWKLSKAFYGAGLKLREQKALEWVEMVRDNPSVFTKTILQDRKFQDGFVYALEHYIQEKNENKRRIMRVIFLGYTQSQNQDEFEIERMYHVLNILGSEDLEVLKDVNITETEFHEIYAGISDKNENIYNLVNSGILMADYSARFGPIVAPFVKITEFGKCFIKFLQ